MPENSLRLLWQRSSFWLLCWDGLRHFGIVNARYLVTSASRLSSSALSSRCPLYWVRLSSASEQQSSRESDPQRRMCCEIVLRAPRSFVCFITGRAWRAPNPVGPERRREVDFAQDCGRLHRARQRLHSIRWTRISIGAPPRSGRRRVVLSAGSRFAVNCVHGPTAARDDPSPIRRRRFNRGGGAAGNRRTSGEALL